RDAYMSVKEALPHAGIHLGYEVDIAWVHSVDLENGKDWDQVKDAHGIVVPGGFGHRGIDGKIEAAKFARENKVPYLGLCLGMQLMVIEHGRAIIGEDGVNSTEFSSDCRHPVIDLMPDQRDITEMGATMRLGLYPCDLKPETKASQAYKVGSVQERHRHRYEFNNSYREVFEKNGMVFSGISPDDRLVEIAELRDHPFMLGTQFHPEFLSRPTRPHPLFVSFLQAAVERAGISV
ncbi:MAG: CTP synthase, partial [Anaerolineae bacterium]|nr:CTP synthase [Anaerolineae bacterium]